MTCSTNGRMSTRQPSTPSLKSNRTWYVPGIPHPQHPVRTQVTGTRKVFLSSPVRHMDTESTRDLPTASSRGMGPESSGTPLRSWISLRDTHPQDYLTSPLCRGLVSCLSIPPSGVVGSHRVTSPCPEWYSLPRNPTTTAFFREGSDPLVLTQGPLSLAPTGPHL